MQLGKASVLVCLAIACLVVAASASARPAASRGLCGTSTIKGHKWLLTTKKSSCATAKTVTGRLANVRVPKNHQLCNGSAGSPCRLKGMECTTTSRPGTKPKMLACFANKSHKTGFGAVRL